MSVRSVSLAVLALVTTSAVAQIVPDALYYRFNEGAGTLSANAAFPGVGTPQGTLGSAMSFGPGRIGTALVGTGATAATNNFATGWTLNLAGTSWTMELWLNLNPSSASLNYLLGVGIGGSFRMYSGATPGTGTIFFTGSGLSSITATGAIPNAGVWTHLAYVFNNSVAPPTVQVFVNGIGGTPIAQTGTLTLGNVGPFTLGGQLAGSAGLNGYMDEFRMWLSARTPAEILANYNQEILNENILASTTTGGGAGYLSISLTAISPTATEGFLLVTSQATGPLGLGPLFGIVPDALTWSVFSSPLVPGNPLHFPIGFPGVFPDQPFTVPPGTLSFLAGQTWDTATVLLTAGPTYVSRSNVSRIVW